MYINIPKLVQSKSKKTLKFHLCFKSYGLEKYGGLKKVGFTKACSYRGEVMLPMGQPRLVNRPGVDSAVLLTALLERHNFIKSGSVPRIIETFTC